MQVGQFVSFTLRVAGAEVAVVDGVLVTTDGSVAGPGADEVAGAAAVVGTDVDGERLPVALPVIVGTGVEVAAPTGVLDLLEVPFGAAARDDSGPSCGTVTTTVAPAGAATGDGAALTAADEVAPDVVDVATVHAVSPIPSSAAPNAPSAAFRRRREAGIVDMHRSYTTIAHDPGNRSDRPAFAASGTGGLPASH